MLPHHPADTPAELSPRSGKTLAPLVTGVVALAEEATNRGGLHEASAETEGRRGLLLQSSRGGRDGLQDRLGLGRHDGSREAIRDRLLPLLLRGSVRGGEKGEKGEGRSDDSGATTRHFHSPSQLVD